MAVAAKCPCPFVKHVRDREHSQNTRVARVGGCGLRLVLLLLEMLQLQLQLQLLVLVLVLVVVVLQPGANDGSNLMQRQGPCLGA